MNRLRQKNNLPFVVAAAIRSELAAQEEAAVRVYLNDEPKASAWALEELLKSYARNSLILYETTADQNAFLVPRALIAHVRLFRTYTRLNDAEKAQQHLVEAMRLSGDKTPEQLLNMIEAADKVEENRIRQPSGSAYPRPAGASER